MDVNVWDLIAHTKSLIEVDGHDAALAAGQVCDGHAVTSRVSGESEELSEAHFGGGSARVCLFGFRLSGGSCVAAIILEVRVCARIRICPTLSLGYGRLVVVCVSTASLLGRRRSRRWRRHPSVRCLPDCRVRASKEGTILAFQVWLPSEAFVASGVGVEQFDGCKFLPRPSGLLLKPSFQVVGGSAGERHNSVSRLFEVIVE